MSNRISLSESMIKRIEEVCKVKSIDFDTFCSNAIYDKLIKDEEKIREKKEKGDRLWMILWIHLML